MFSYLLIFGYRPIGASLLLLNFIPCHSTYLDDFYDPGFQFMLNLNLTQATPGGVKFIRGENYIE